MVKLTAILAAIGALQLIVFGLQAWQLRQTIVTMKDLGRQQSADMQASIAIAKESADVARKSVEVFERQTRASIAIERPHILIGKDIAVTAVEGTTFVPFQLPDHPIATFKIINIGRTHAEPSRWCIETIICKKLPDIPGYNSVLRYPARRGHPPNGRMANEAYF